MLDLGAGAGRVTEMDFLGHAARVVGVDPDEAVTPAAVRIQPANPALS